MGYPKKKSWWTLSNTTEYDTGLTLTEATATAMVVILPLFFFASRVFSFGRRDGAEGAEVGLLTL
jgi:hypothetical protein